MNQVYRPAIRLAQPEGLEVRHRHRHLVPPTLKVA